MAADKVEKKDQSKEGGFVIKNIQNGGFLYFPFVKNMKENAILNFNIASLKTGIIEVRAGSKTGTLLGTCTVKPTGGLSTYQNMLCKLKNKKGTQNLYFVFRVAKADLFNLNYFKFE